MEALTGIAKIIQQLRDYYNCYLDNSVKETDSGNILYRFNYRDCCVIDVTASDIHQDGQCIYMPKEGYKLLIELSDILEKLQ